jgi:dolichol-phosphate mannosyltransferase
MRALVILPTYNEVGNLGPLVEAITGQGEMFHLLIIDDGSPDGTGLLADHLKTQYPGRIEVLHRQGKLGLATAYLAGFQYGIAMGYDYLFEMDADFSHQPRYLPEFISAMKMKGADVVLGSRYVEGGGVAHWPWYRRLISVGGSQYARIVLGLSIRDLTGGFKCFRREVLEAIQLDEIEASGYGFQIEMTYRAVQHGFKVVEIPIIFEDRREGQSKMSASIFTEALWMVAKLRLSEQVHRKARLEGDRIRS